MLPEVIKSSRYRPEIDGLRAVAVIPVLLFHAFLPGFSGGFIGVDVFFVISGYLITGIIAREMVEERFSFANFYERRIRRLLPPLVPLLVFVWLMSVFTANPQQYADFLHSLLATLGLGSNWFFLGQNGYFDAAAETQPLLHMWSLSIEEQFYLVYPLALLLMIRRSARFALGVTAALVLMSLSYAVWLIAADAQQTAFFNSLARFWELGFGSLLALAVHCKVLRIGADGVFPVLGRLVGIALIIASIVWLSPETPFPGLTALPAVVGTGLLLISGRGGDPVSRLLCSALAKGIGKISYGLYIWHWPMLVFAHRIMPEGGLRVALAALAIGTAFAIASYYLVETPTRTKQVLGSRKAAYGGFIASMAALVAIAWAPATAALETKRLDLAFGENGVRMQAVEAERLRYDARVNRNFSGVDMPFDAASMGSHVCSLDGGNTEARLLECLRANLGENGILIIGDSVGREVFHAMRAAYPQRNVAMLHQSACVAAPYQSERRACFPDLDAIIDELSQTNRADIILLSFRFKDEDWQMISRSLPMLKPHARRVVVAGVAPVFKVPLPQRLADLAPEEEVQSAVENDERDLFLGNTYQTLTAVAELARSNGANYLSLNNFYCTRTECRLWLDDDKRVPLFWDRQHLTVSGIDALSERLAADEGLRKLLGEPAAIPR